MLPRVDATFDASLATSPNRPRIHGFLAAVAFVYFVGMAGTITGIFPSFITLFAGLQVDVPWPTRVLLDSHSWFLPPVFAIGAILIVAKDSVGFSRPQLRIVNSALLFIGAILPGAILFVLCLPLLVLIVRAMGT